MHELKLKKKLLRNEIDLFIFCVRSLKEKTNMISSTNIKNLILLYQKYLYMLVIFTVC